MASWVVQQEHSKTPRNRHRRRSIRLCLSYRPCRRACLCPWLSFRRAPCTSPASPPSRAWLSPRLLVSISPPESREGSAVPTEETRSLSETSTEVAGAVRSAGRLCAAAKPTVSGKQTGKEPRCDNTPSSAWTPASSTCPEASSHRGSSLSDSAGTKLQGDVSAFP